MIWWVHSQKPFIGHKEIMDAQDYTRKIQPQTRISRDGLCELTPLPFLDEPLVGHYVYKGLLGIGGMGVVYKALNSYLDKIVAIKTLKGKRYTEKELLRFRHEAPCVVLKYLRCTGSRPCFKRANFWWKT